MCVLKSAWLVPLGGALLVAATIAAGLQAWSLSVISAALGLGLVTAEGFRAAGLNRVGLALVLAPLATCLVLGFVYSGQWWLAPVFPFAYMFGLLGIPAYFLFKRLGWLRPWQVAAGGAALGLGVALLLNAHEPTAVLRFAGLGALASSVFWLIAFAGGDQVGKGASK